MEKWQMELLIQLNFLLGIVVGITIAPLLQKGGSDDDGSA